MKQIENTIEREEKNVPSSAAVSANLGNEFRRRRSIPPTPFRRSLFEENWIMRQLAYFFGIYIGKVKGNFAVCQDLFGVTFFKKSDDLFCGH